MVGTEERLAESDPHDSGPRRKRARPNHHPAAEPDADRDVRDEVSAGEDQDDQYLAAFKDSLDQSVLPNLPPMPDFHVCWLTTTNPRDTIPNRLNTGYQLITDQMVPGFRGASPKSAQYPGVLSVNEMLAARIPLRIYNRMMRFVHHDMPLSEEEKLRATVDRLKEGAEAQGSKLQEGDGMAGIVQRAKPMPTFRE